MNVYQKHLVVSDEDWKRIVEAGQESRFIKVYERDLEIAKGRYEGFVGSETAESDYRIMEVMGNDLLPDTMIFDILAMYRELAMKNTVFPTPEEPPTEGEFDKYGNRQVYP